MKGLKHSLLKQRRSLIPCLFVSISCLLIPSILAADFDSGLRAYKKGDYATALKELRPLAEQGQADAQFFLGLMYASGQGVPQDYKEAVKWYSLAAEKGQADAQFFLGGMYDKGEGVPQDYKEAVKWYRLAAGQGDSDAQFFLGLMYEYGQGVPQDYKEAVKWYRLAATHGYGAAQNRLGVMYEFGKGVPQDDKQAVKWYRLAAEQGKREAQFNLGLMYEMGQGVPQDEKQAVKWYRKAAEQGNSEAQYFLGHMYMKGRGVPQDDKQAVKWYRLAAEQGKREAQFNLGLMYKMGQGVPQDYVQAHMWVNLASANGDVETVKFRDRLAEEMTPQQLAEAQRLAGQWKKKSAPAPSQPTLPDNEPKTSPRVVSSGTGFVCGDDLIATNYHVIRDGSTWEINFPTSGRTYQLQLVTADKTNDLAVLKLIHGGSGESNKQKPLQITAFSQEKIGEELYTIGFPLGDILGSSHKVAAGLLSSTSGIDNDPRMFQISVPIQPGNSGGPIFNSKGEVIGILVSTLSAKYLFQSQRHIPQNVNFAIKSDYLLALIPQRSLDLKVQTGNLSNLSRVDQVEALRDSIGQVKTVSGSIK